MKSKLYFLFVAFLLAAPAHAQILIKQSTATTVNFKLTKIADGTDDTAATVTNITLKIVKHSDTSSSSVTSVACAASGSSNDCVHVAAGLYNAELTSGNTDTLGRLDICAVITGDYTDCTRYEVLSAAGYTLALDGITSSAFASGAITAASIAADAITNAKIANDAIGATEIADNAIDANTLASDVATEVQTGLYQLKKNTATITDRIKFFAYDTSGAVTKTASAVSCQISLDGGAPATVTDAPVEVEFTTGAYWKFGLTQAETNAEQAMIMCTGTGLADTPISIEFQH